MKGFHPTVATHLLYGMPQVTNNEVALHTTPVHEQSYMYTSKMIHHCGASLSKQCCADLMIYHGTQTKDNVPKTFSLRERFTCKCTHLKFMVYGCNQASKQTCKHKHTRAQCSPTSTGLTQACPNDILLNSTIRHTGAKTLYTSVILGKAGQCGSRS